MPVLGVLGRDDAVAAPSRHLGLVPAAERQDAARQAIVRLATLVAKFVDLDAVVALAASAGPLTAAPWSPLDAVLAPGGRQDPSAAAWPRAGGPPVVAVAGGGGGRFFFPMTTPLRPPTPPGRCPVVPHLPQAPPPRST